MATTKPRHPWNRRKGEPDSAYTHFLLYRNLGPARSIDRAYAAYQATSQTDEAAADDEAAKRGKTRRAPGNWWEEAATYDWGRRAAAWDLAVLADTGRSAIVTFTTVLEKVSVRCLAAVVDGEIAPDSWGKLIETINTLGLLIPSDLIRDVARQSEGEREADRGRSGQPTRHPAA
jgi:hypothetical protein